MPTRLQERVVREDDAFTLLELLIVMIIIGILAGIGVPAFLNQQGTSRDTSLTADVKNLSINVHTALAKYPNATYFAIQNEFQADGSPTPASGANTGPDAYAWDWDYTGKVKLWVGNATPAGNLISGEYEEIIVTISEGTRIALAPGPEPGTFVIKGYNAKAKTYYDDAHAKTYDSLSGVTN